MFLKLISILVTPFFIGKPVLAGQNESFLDTSVRFSVACVKDECAKPFEKKIIAPDFQLKKYFAIIAKKQAQIWGDTILEGDFVADGNTRLDEVRELKIRGERVGYLITYSEKAWNVSDCRYDGVTPSQLGECESGRIVESSYVSLDLRQYFYDDTTAATFK